MMAIGSNSGPHGRAFQTEFMKSLATEKDGNSNNLTLKCGNPEYRMFEIRMSSPKLYSRLAALSEDALYGFCVLVANGSADGKEYALEVDGNEIPFVFVKSHYEYETLQRYKVTLDCVDLLN